ncbi:g11383 [Coccomyxa viridis]|uniref:G11383 protein n=1 Tax=Coccomyxa viridis TaxID=1274662 RepID=A0ABP1GCI8_9CHLO
MMGSLNASTSSCVCQGRVEEEAPAASQEAATTSSPEEDDEFKFAFDFTNTDDLYKRFNELIERQAPELQMGDRVIGTVASVDQAGAYVDFGGKMPLFCPLQECSILKLQSAEQAVAPDQQREFAVNFQDRKSGEMRLSIKVIEKELAWQRIRQIAEEQAFLTAKVESARPAGLIVKVFDSIQGFVPGSHTLESPGLPHVDLEEMVGREMTCKVLEAIEENDRLVLSNRKSAFGQKKLSYNVGDVVEGTVATIQPYGAFVNLGSDLNGLLHISQISHDRISSVEQVLEVGQKLKVMILTLDKEKGRVSLSTKKLEPTPGDMVRDPNLVFSRADEMAAAFRERYRQAEAEARG